MSEQYDQAVKQRTRFEKNNTDWLTIAIASFAVLSVLMVLIAVFGGSSSETKLSNEFQKTLFEQIDELQIVNSMLVSDQQKSKRYFFKLNKFSDQINHRFEIISEFIENNDLEVDRRQFNANEALYRKKLKSILDSKKDLIKYSNSIFKMKSALPKLLAQNTEINNTLFKNNASNNHIYYVTRQLFLIERINSNVRLLESNLTNPSLIVTTADRMARDLALLIRVYSGLLKGDYKMNVSKINNLKVRDELNKVRKISKVLSKEVKVVLQNGPEAFQFIDSRIGIHKYSLKLQNNYQSLFFESY